MKQDHSLLQRKRLIGEIITRMAVAGLPEFLQENIISNLFYFSESDLRIILDAFRETTETHLQSPDTSLRYQAFLEELSAKLEESQLREADAIKAELEAELHALTKKVGNS